MPIQTLIHPDYPVEKFGLVSAGCHDKFESNHHLKKKKQLCNQQNTFISSA